MIFYFDLYVNIEIAVKPSEFFFLMFIVVPLPGFVLLLTSTRRLWYGGITSDALVRLTHWSATFGAYTCASLQIST